MADTWYVVLRDIMVILAAGSVISLALFTGLVLWQLYRLAIELREESAPIVEAVMDTAETVRETAHFVGDKAVPPALTGIGLTSGAVRVYTQLSRFYQGFQRQGAPKLEKPVPKPPLAGASSGTPESPLPAGSPRGTGAKPSAAEEAEA